MRVPNFLAIFLCVMLMLFSSSICCGAAVLAEKISNTSSGCRGGGSQIEDDVGLIGDDMEVEMLMESHISRMLAGNDGKSKTKFTGDREQTIKPCGPSPQRGACLGDKKIPDNCNTYHRGCKKRPS